LAYTDKAFPTIGGLTTSAPSVIAEMIFNAGLKSGDKVLEIGTGTGYEAAVLAEMGVKVFTIEIDKQTAEKANRILVNLGYKIDKQLKNKQRRKDGIKRFNRIKTYFLNREKIELYWGNGRNGLEEYSPFKGIIVAASIPNINDIKNLVSQLSPKRGRLVVPVGSRYEQTLHIIERQTDKVHLSILEGVTFNFIRMVKKE
ncbi:MAG: rRNA adenine N-6-methyltransferase family protein, partial [Spirochaetota bacterium]